MHTIIIETDDAYARIQDLAEREGKSVSTVVIEAIDEKLDRERKPQINEERMQYFLDLGRRIREQTPPELLDLNVDELLYDEWGMPK